MIIKKPEDDGILVLGVTEFEETCEKINYLLSDKVLSNMNYLMVLTDLFEFDIEFESDTLLVPKLIELSLVGSKSLQFFQKLNTRFLSPPPIETIYADNIVIEDYPEFLKNLSLKSLGFRHCYFNEILNEIFDMTTLQTLKFNYAKKIKRIPDDIQKLTSLVKFELWESRIEYMSPELFLLPEIKEISFAFSSYTPTKEVLNALEIYKSKPGNLFYGWWGYDDK
ncbi:MAG: hypothetical protein HGA37_02770 [Lentimicrobium sp.]|nr:hypothetical protein [Lentimicrobium sp.]